MATIRTKNLTATNILWVLGKSERPLTSQEIRNQIDPSKSKKDSGWDGHRILKKLAPTGKFMRGDEKLFELDDLYSRDINNNIKIIKKLICIFKLNWEISKVDIDPKYLKVERKDEKNNSVIKFSYDDTKFITIIINKSSDEPKIGFCKFFDGEKSNEYPIWIEKNQKKKLTANTIIETDYPIKYLDISFDTKTQKLISLLENDKISGLHKTGEIINKITQENFVKHINSISKIDELESNRSKWKYSLNLKSFIMYLNFENLNNRLQKKLCPKNQDSKIINKNINLENDRSIKKIRQVLSNPTIKDRFIYLKSWEKFEENGFNVIETLLQITNEFRQQLEKHDENYLIVRVTERYLSEIDNHFSKYGSFFHPCLSLSQETENMLNQYRLMVLEFLEKELILYTKNISKQIRYIKSGIDE
jgi:hypothetical protein